MQAATRPQDYLYDSNYTVACKSDHLRTIAKASTHTVTIHPVHENMFSTLAHYSSKQFSIVSNKMNASLGNDRRPYYRGIPQQAPNDVTGMNRFRYFKRPLNPYMPSLGGTIVYAKMPTSQNEPTIVRPKSPFSKDVSVQTQYRDSSAQTSPYTPEYTVVSHTTPELLALVNLTYSKGLPAGAVELEMIERARMKRAWEKSLPTVVDQESFEKRLKMMEEMELREWKERDDEIKRIQEVRLDILAQVIRKREDENECINSERVEKIWQSKLKERESFIDNIQKKRAKAMRKLAEKRSKIVIPVAKRDIITEYADYTSRVYAPKPRDGFTMGLAASNISLKLSELAKYSALERLELKMPHEAFAIDTSRNNSIKSKDISRGKQLMQKQLELMDARLKERNARSIAVEPPLKFAQIIQKPPARPEAFKTIAIPERDILRENSALLLQKFIRGRINQNLMYEGKERRRELIAELRIRNLYRVDNTATQKDTTEEHDKAQTIKSDFVQPGEIEVKYVEEIVSDELQYPITEPDPTNYPIIAAMQSEYVATTLDFLTKELTRLRQEQVIAAVVRIAERSRRLREAEENGRRTEELERRRVEDLVFCQVINVHSETVDTFLQDIIERGVDLTGAVQARTKIGEYAEKINSIVDSIDESENDTTIADLVASFLIPEVERSIIRQRVANTQEKFLLAAQQAIDIQIPIIVQTVMDQCEESLEKREGANLPIQNDFEGQAKMP